MKKTFYILLFVIYFGNFSYSQSLVNTRIKKICSSYDTIQIDTLSIWEKSIKFYDSNKNLLDSIDYQFDFFSSTLIFIKKPKTDSLIIEYKIFPIDYSKPIQLFEKEKFLVSDRSSEKKYDYIIQNENYTSFANNEELSRRGSISRGLSFGNNQDVVLNSGLNLQLDGKLNDELYITAAITDNNIPIQPEGNTQHLQEFDKVFIKIYNDNISLTFGDFEIKKPEGYFMNYFKKVQGINISVNGETFINNKKLNIQSSLSGALSKGKFNRMEFNGQEGNQGPYKLNGANNEMNVIILAGSEKVFIDGILQTRGAENDYIIDYNTGELTFTPNQPINKDKRIIIEFEYTEKSYTRFLINNTNIVKVGDSEFYLNYYEEKDNKNSPIDQDLSTFERFLLSEAGDNPNFAVVPAFDSLGFSDTEIRYELKDTTVDGITYDSIFVYSTNPDKAYYRLSFAYVGINKGFYKKSVSAANGRVFEWVPPIDGIPQGDYTPYKVLISPTKTQLITIGSNIKLNNKTKLKAEIAFSNNDKNTFSKKDSYDDNGIAVNSILERQLMQTKKSLLNAKINYSYQQKNFKAIENYRSSEFTRDWNLTNYYPESDENFINFTLLYELKNKLSASTNLSLLDRGSFYNGKMGNIITEYKYNNWEINANFSALNTLNQNISSIFIRHNAVISKSFKKIKIGLGEQAENNQLTNVQLSELSKNSFAFQSFNGYIKSNDSTKIDISLDYNFRKDFLPLNNKLAIATESNNLSYITKYKINNNNMLSTTINYRALNIVDTTLYAQASEDNLLGRFEYSYGFLKNLFSGNIFYETGSGMERKLEFSYLEVSPGQGVYTWTDYNNNGTKELDEFDIAYYSDQANYIRIFTPSAEYIKTYTNQFSQLFNITPEAIWSKEKGLKKFLSKFSNQLAYRTGTKNTSKDFWIYANPFVTNTNDINLVNINQSLRNKFSFNRTSPKFGIDYIYQENNNKLLLVSGYDTRKSKLNTIQLRYQLNSHFGLESKANIGSKYYNSEFFSSKNFNINNNSLEFKISYQPNLNLRFLTIYEYKNKENKESTEILNSNKGGIECSIMTAKKSMINFNFNLIYNNYNSLTNTPIAYEMLEGLMPGMNFTWTLNIQRKLANGLQVNLLYSARKSPDIKIIHNAGIQMRAFF